MSFCELHLEVKKMLLINSAVFFFFLKKKTKRGHSQSEGLFIVCISVDAFRCLSALETLWPANGELSSREGCGCQLVEAPVLRSLARWERSSLFFFPFPSRCSRLLHASRIDTDTRSLEDSLSLLLLPCPACQPDGRLLLLCLQSLVLLFNPVPLYGLPSHV